MCVVLETARQLLYIREVLILCDNLYSTCEMRTELSLHINDRLEKTDKFNYQL